MTPSQRKIHFVLKQTKLSANQIDEFIGYCAFGSDQQIESIVASLLERPALAASLLKNIRAKRTAIKQKDEAAWMRIIQEEVDGIASLKK